MRAPAPALPPAASARRFVALLVTAAALLLALAPGASGTTTDTDAQVPADEPVVEILPVEGYLDPPTEAAIRRLLDEAPEQGVDLVVLQLRHDAVVSVDTAALADAIAESAVPVAVYVGPQGTAAPLAGGALELLAAADVRSAAIDAELGPLTPLDVSDAISDEADAAALARLEARWPEGAALFADAPRSAVIVGEGGAVDAPTQAELALDRVVPRLDALLAELDGVEVETSTGTVVLELRADEGDVRFRSLSLPGRILHASASPAFVYLLLVVGLGMLLFEVFQPGFGVAGFAGLVAVALGGVGLAVFPVTWWAVALVVLGMVLYAVDTAIAGFGLVTVAATASLVVGSLSFYDSDVVAVGGWLTGLTTLTVLGFFVIGMTVILRAQAGPVDVTVDDLVGRAGIVRSVLNPEGHVYVDGALWRARWTGDGRRAKVGTPVRVHGTDGAVVLVEPFEPGDADAPTGAGAPAATDDPTTVPGDDPNSAPPGDGSST